MKQILYVLIIFCLLAILPNIVIAADNQTDDTAYYVEAIQPASQIDNRYSYFDLLVRPGKTENLKLKVQNFQNKKKTFQITLHTARTEMSGDIDYSGDKRNKLAKSLAYSLEDIIKGSHEITLKAYESKTVTFQLKMPKKAFSGVLLGGFHIQEKNAKKTAKSSEDSVSIQNRYAYVIGCKVRTSMTEVPQKFSLEKPKLVISNDSALVTADFINDSSRIISTYRLQGEIKNSVGKTVHKICEQEFSMAPNSIYQVRENIAISKFSAGEYEYRLTVKGENKTWHFNKKLSISEEATQQLTEQSPPPKSSVWEIIIVIILLSILFILTRIILRMIWTKKRK